MANQDQNRRESDANQDELGVDWKAAWETEDNYWQENFSSRPYALGPDYYDRFRPAYRYGFESARDGFDVAERDLELRGAGDFLGTRQAGLPRFRFGNILRDHALMEQARDAAIETIEKIGLESATNLLGELAPELKRKAGGKD